MNLNVLSTNVLHGANGMCHTDTPRIKLIAGIRLVSFVWKLIFSMWYLAIALIPLNLFITHGLFSNGVYSIRICISEMLYIPQEKWDLVPVKHISVLSQSCLCLVGYNFVKISFPPLFPSQSLPLSSGSPSA